MGNPAPQKIIHEIQTYRSKLKQQDFYERLGIEKGADNKTIKRSYMQLAARWHPDRFSQFELGPAAKELQQLFALLTEAHTTLTNASRREEYDAGLALGVGKGGGGGHRVDPRAVFQADSVFKLGTQLLEQRKYKAALEKFEQAVELNSDSNIFRAYHHFAQYQTLPKAKNGKPASESRAQDLKKKIEECCAETEEFDMGHVFLGYIALDQERSADARRHFRIALGINGKNLDAKRQLRLMKMRKDTPKGLMGKLKSFFGG